MSDTSIVICVFFVCMTILVLALIYMMRVDQRSSDENIKQALDNGYKVDTTYGESK